MPDAFDILGLPPRFDLTPQAIQQAYLARAAAAHPDRAAAQGRALDPAIEATSELNLARRTLEDPESRADLLITRLGGPRRDQDRTLRPTFLAEMMETREQIEAAVASKDDDAISRWEDWADQKRRDHIAQVGALLAMTPSPPDATKLRSARHVLNEWRYTERLLEQLTGPGASGL